MIDQPTTIKYTVFGISVVVFCLFVTSCTVPNGCYTSPCMEGDGINYIWSIHPGVGFQLVVTSLALIAHTTFTFKTLFKESHSDLRYGVLAGSSGFIALLMLLQLVFYASRSGMISGLHAHAKSVDASGDAAYYEHNAACKEATTEQACVDLTHKGCAYVSDPYRAIGALSKGCYRRMTINYSTKSSLDATAVFSAFLFIGYGAFFLMLVKWHDDFGGGSSGSSQGPDASRINYAGYEGQIGSTMQNGMSKDDEPPAPQDGVDISYQQDGA